MVEGCARADEMAGGEWFAVWDVKKTLQRCNGWKEDGASSRLGVRNFAAGRSGRTARVAPSWHSWPGDWPSAA